MGNRQLLMNHLHAKEEDEEEDVEQQIKKKNKQKKLVQPYNHDAVETGFVSPIKQYLPVQQEETLFVKRPEQLENKNVVDYIQDLHKKFTNDTKLEQIQQDFLKGQRENIMGKQNFLKFIWNESNLQYEDEDDEESANIEDCQFVQLFFKACMKILDTDKTGQFMDYSKILKIVHLMQYGKKNEQLEFFFSLFDANNDGKIERDELNYFYQIFFEFLMQAPFVDQDNSISKLKWEIQKSKEKDISNAIKKMSDEINQQYCNRQGNLTYEQWQQLMEKEYLQEIYGANSSVLESEVESPNKSDFYDHRNQKQTVKDNNVSFTLDGSQTVSPNVFTNYNRNNTFNQTLPTETAKREEPQMIFKDKKDLIL